MNLIEELDDDRGTSFDEQIRAYLIDYVESILPMEDAPERRDPPRAAA